VNGGHFSVLEVLLAHGADVNAQNFQKETPTAMAFCDFKCLTLLLMQKDVNLSLLPQEVTAEILYQAKLKNDSFIVAKMHELGVTLTKSLVSPGNEHEISDFYEPENIAILSAASEGDVSRVNEFIAKPGEIDKTNTYGQSVLHIAAFYRKAEVVEALLKAKFPVNSLNMDKATPLHSACIRDDNEDVVNLLLNCGANPLLFDKGDNSPFHTAARHGQVKTLNLLFNSSMDEKFQRKAYYFSNKRGMTMGDIAAFYGKSDVIRLIYAKSILRKINVFEEEKKMLQLSVSQGHDEIVKLLIDGGINPTYTGEVLLSVFFWLNFCSFFSRSQKVYPILILLTGIKLPEYWKFYRTEKVCGISL
jgi:ankyrin repeat protein